MLDFKLEPPKQGKIARQLRERAQYWGPDQIPAEYLSSLTESFRNIVDAGLCQSMFSDKMEHLLQALQCWKRQIPSNAAKIFDVMDMVLKWLTWVLFNTNTQIWKSALEALNSLLEVVAAAGVQLTDREAQILVPNIVEKSGHNNQSIRESMMQVLTQCSQVYSRKSLLPMLLNGLTSKNKRSANCALRVVATCVDRQVAFQLLRSQKDVTAMLKMLEDKDVELRKSAVHTIALLSLHAEADVFTRGCGSKLSKDALLQVKAAAARLPPVGEEQCSAMDTSQQSAQEETSRVVARAMPTRQATPPKQRGSMASDATSAARPGTPTKQRSTISTNGSSLDANAIRTSTPTRRAPAGSDANARREHTPNRHDGSAAVAAGAERVSGRVSTPLRTRAAVVANVAAEARRQSAPVASSEMLASPGPKPSPGQLSPGRFTSLDGTVGASPSGCLRRPRIASPSRHTQARQALASTTTTAAAEVAEARTPAPAPSAALKCSPSPSPIPLRSVSPGARSTAGFLKLLGDLDGANTDATTFKELSERVCVMVKEGAPESYDTDALGDTLLSLLQKKHKGQHCRREF
jgi:hypothetical protein